MMGQRSGRVVRVVPVPGHLAPRPVYTGPVPRGLADEFLRRRPSLGVVGPESVPNWDQLAPEQKAAAARNLVTADLCQRLRCGLITPAEAGPAAGLCALGYPDMGPAPSSPCDQSCSPYWAEVWRKFRMGCDAGPSKPVPVTVEKQLPPAPLPVPVTLPTVLNKVYHPVLYPAGPYVRTSWDLPTCDNPQGCASASVALAPGAAAGDGATSMWWWLLAGVVVGAAAQGERGRR